MSDTNSSRVLPPAEELTAREARDVSATVRTAIGAGTVQETARVEGYLSRLQVAAQVPSQGQRDTARQAAPAAQAAAASATVQPSQQVQQTASAQAPRL